jgi:hypothetical protein
MGAKSPGLISCPPEDLASAIVAALNDHFAFSSVEGLVKLEADSIAADVLRRLEAQGPNEQ